MTIFLDCQCGHGHPLELFGSFYGGTRKQTVSCCLLMQFHIFLLLNFIRNDPIFFLILTLRELRKHESLKYKAFSQVPTPLKLQNCNFYRLQNYILLGIKDNRSEFMKLILLSISSEIVCLVEILFILHFTKSQHPYQNKNRD